MPERMMRELHWSNQNKSLLFWNGLLCCVCFNCSWFEFRCARWFNITYYGYNWNIEWAEKEKLQQQNKDKTKTQFFN